MLTVLKCMPPCQIVSEVERHPLGPGPVQSPCDGDIDSQSHTHIQSTLWVLILGKKNVVYTFFEVEMFTVAAELKAVWSQCTSSSMSEGCQYCRNTQRNFLEQILF